MSTISQETWDRVFERIGGTLGGLKRYEDAANLVGSTSYFLFRQRDEFKFFPDPKTAFDKMTNLLRAIGYDAADDVLKIEITDIGPGTTYDLFIKDAFGGTTLASITGGAYGADVVLVPAVAILHAPGGKLNLTAPTGAPGALQEVEIRVVGSAVRVTNDVTGETEEEGLIESAALETHQITAGNFRDALRVAARDRVVLERLLQDFVGPIIGSDTTAAFSETQTVVDGTEAVISQPTGLLAELDTTLKLNTPVQTVEEIVAVIASVIFTSLSSPATLPGVQTITEKQPTAGTLEITCIEGFGGNEDAEKFSVRLRSTTLKKTINAVANARVFQSYEWLTGGFDFTIDRLTTENDALSRMSAEKVTEVDTFNMKNERFTIETDVTVSTSTFKIINPATGGTIFTVVGGTLNTDPLGAGTFDFLTTFGARVQFTWDGATPANDGIRTFDLIIHPYRVGDRFSNAITISGGRLQVELRKQYDFAFQQRSGTPTIPDDVIPPDLPFITPFLGA